MLTNWHFPFVDFPSINFSSGFAEKEDVIIVPVIMDDKEIKCPPLFSKLIQSEAVNEKLKAKAIVTLYGINLAEKPQYNICLLLPISIFSSSNTEEKASLTAAVDSFHSLSNLNKKNTTIYLEEMSINFICRFVYAFLMCSFTTGSFKSDKIKEAKKFYQIIENRKLSQLNIIHKELISKEQEMLNYWLNLAKGTWFTRNVLNQPGTAGTPEWIHNVAQELVSENSDLLSIEAIVGKELYEKGMNLIYSVGMAGKSEPRMILIKYHGNKGSNEYYSLVGKGVTFDTGGLNLKSSGNIEDMYLDKGGACAVLGVMKTLVSLKSKINVVGCLALADNAIDANSYHPGDVLKSLNGLTVEVGNTDAEGRLCLADTMTYVQRKYKPLVVIDIATLTGAIVVALGSEATGLFSNNENLSNEIREAGLEVYENNWKMPIFPGHEANVKGNFGDLLNTSLAGRNGGACTAAAFLKSFVEPGVMWAHLDIAGTGILSSSKGIWNKGGNGYGLSTMMNYLQRKAEKN